MDKKLSRERLQERFTPNILILDEEPRERANLKSLLSDLNYNIFTSESGQEALDFLSRERLDILILDIVPAESDGQRVMDHIKRKSPETLIILITGSTSMESALEALKGGAYDCLRKPFEAGELLKTVENALSQKKLKYENGVVSAKLALLEQRHKYLSRNSPDILYALDERGNFTFVSEAVEALLRLKCEDLQGKHYSTIVAGEDLEKAQWVFNERRTGDRASSGTELRLKICGNGDRPKNHEGRHKTVELKSTGIYDRPVTEKGKRFLGTFGVARDISDRKRMEIQLQQAQRMEAIGTLAGGVAHDFNNLLTAIQARTSLMLMDIDPSHAHFEHLMGIGEYTKSAADLTKQILGFARGGRYEPRTTDLNKFMKKQNRMFGCTKKEVTVRGKYQDDLWNADVDQVQLEQVLLNLYVNASDAMPAGGDLYVQTENVTIQRDCAEVFQVEPGKYVKISVTDTGTGMEEAVKERIFNPFFTTKETGRGAGLGLASAYGIIKNHRGIINVYSEKGHGTTFTIYLPASEKEIPEEEGPERHVVHGSESILIIDDESMVIDVGERVLKKMGYKVFTATGGVEGIEVYRRNSDKIDMVILDMIMPGMSGSEVYENLRKINPAIKVLLSSGYSINGRAREILDRGCNGFVQKPFTLDDLSRKLREVLDGNGTKGHSTLRKCDFLIAPGPVPGFPLSRE